MAKLIGILGGTFDPVHIGHLKLASEIYQSLNMDEIKFIPLHTPYHRDEPTASNEQRIKMLNLATEDKREFTVDAREISRRGTSYTIDTLISLREELINDSLLLILGLDAFQKINIWYRWKELLEFCHIIIANRPGTNALLEEMDIEEFYSQHLINDTTSLKHTNRGKILKLELPLLEISSTRVRELIKQNENLQELLPVKIIEYIQAEKLYQ